MANKKYDFKTPLKGADGENLKENNLNILLSITLSNLILNSNTTDGVMKFFDWALELRKTGELHLDETDKDALSRFILSSPHIPNLTKGRLNEILLQK